MLNMHRIVKEITHIEKLGIKRPLKRLDTQRSANKKCYASECFHQIKMMTFGIRSSRSSSVLFYSVFRAKPARHGFRPSVVTLGNTTQVCVPHPTPNPSRTFGCSRFFFFFNFILSIFITFVISPRLLFIIIIAILFVMMLCKCCRLSLFYFYFSFYFVSFRLTKLRDRGDNLYFAAAPHISHTHTQHKRTQIVDAKARSKSCVRSNE